MDNHYHLLIQTSDGNLSKGICQLNGVYTQISTQRHQRESIYPLELSRYVVHNPVSATIVASSTD